ncbi:hypothetical protein [Mangrovivirga cuniculi]|nr:hypothetical protein [Mangrovivirga cuniculi]
MRKTRVLAAANMLVLLGTIYWNYFSNTGMINGNTVGSVSQKYYSLFTPAGYAFAIWGIIYFALFVQACYLIYKSVTKDEDAFIKKLVPYMVAANIANCFWIYFWLKEMTGISILVMIVILIALLAAVIKLNMERWDAPVPYMAAVWWPTDLYAGWISVALIANVAAHLKGIGWEAVFSEITWTIIMIGIATAIYLFMIFKRNMREFAAVGIWAFIAIAVRHWDTYISIKWAALAGAFIILFAASYHAYKNRHTLPFVN